jgi:cobyrinic acid a,c-diamide synthase
MGRTMVALLAGLLQYDSDRRIVGVILNRTTAQFCETIRPVIEEELGLPVFGFFPKLPDLQLESRHLGLKLPGEIAGLREQIGRAADALQTGVAIAEIQRVAHDWARQQNWQLPSVASAQVFTSTTRIAVARDEAFCFYYEDNLRMLQEAGAELLYFSPLHDRRLPEEADGILLGGGYPELCAEQLSRNRSLRDSIRAAIAAGMPSVAECGGFLYLHETLTGESGRDWPMVGAVPGGSRYMGRLVRFGYVELREKEAHFLGKGTIRGHEFHYFDSDHNGADCTAVKPVTGKQWDCVHTGENHWWGYPHLYYPSNPAFVDSFVAMARRWSKRRSL